MSKKSLKHFAAIIALSASVALPLTSVIANETSPANAAENYGNDPKLISALIDELNQHYVFADKAKKIDKALRQHLRQGAYRDVADGEKLAALLTEHLQKETQDIHLQVEFSEDVLPLPNPDGKPSAEEQAEEREMLKALNYGVERVERLPFNIGYLDLRGFAPAHDATAALSSAMTLLTHSNALIIDLRKNGGGEPSSVAMLASYFFDERTHLVDTYFRAGDRTEQTWSSEYVAGSKYGQQKDVYILISKDSFSAAESFSYMMKNLHRATLIGERSGGGAHPGDFVRLNDHFQVFVPNGRSLSPITKTNWEAVGVAPDIAAPAATALQTAQLNYLSKQLAAEKNPGRVKRLQTRIAKLEAEIAAETAAP